MNVPQTRRAALGMAAGLLAGLVAGCQQSNEIPLVEFPKGAPAPPPQVSSPKDAHSGASTSQGEPAH